MTKPLGISFLAVLLLAPTAQAGARFTSFDPATGVVRPGVGLTDSRTNSFVRSPVGGPSTAYLRVECAATRRAARIQKPECAKPVVPKYTYVEEIQMVPQMVTERRKVTTTEYRCEERQRTVTKYECVPETKVVPHTETVMTTEVRQRPETYTVTKPVCRQVGQPYTVTVPCTETRTGTRQVCKKVPVVRKHTVCEDHGHWETRCDCHGQSHCVWVPNIVAREVESVDYVDQIVDEPYEYQVTVDKTETRTRKVTVCEDKVETRTRMVDYTVQVPKQQTRYVEVTTYKTVPKQYVETYHVQVPVTVEKCVDVQVCKMVPKKVIKRVPCHSTPAATRVRK